MGRRGAYRRQQWRVSPFRRIHRLHRTGLYHVSSQSQLLVIDGQQRLTLLIAGLAKALGEAEPVDGFSPRKLRNYYLLNPEEVGERYFKLLLSQTNKSSLTAIVGSSEQPKESSLRVTQNFALFESWIAELKGNFYSGKQRAGKAGGGGYRPQPVLPHCESRGNS